MSKRPIIAFLSCVLFATQLFAQATTSPPVKLVLVVTVDQMRYDYLTRFAPLFQSGFKTLLDKGAVFTEARYRHANTETGPGHGVILSGRHGSHSGIVANEWYDSYLKRVVNVVDDPIQRPVGGKGRGASPANFIGFTIGDVLKLHFPGMKVVGVSTKDRAAILPAGKLADGAFWFEKEEGKYITSSYYLKQAPAWLDKWNEKRFPDQFFGKPWTRLKSDTEIYEKFAGPDKVFGEWDNKDTVFPHEMRGTAHDTSYYSDFLRTPFIDEMTLDFALNARSVYRMGEDETPDLLAVSFSATDYIGHTYGPDSQEQMDQLLRLDQVLGKLFAEIEKKIGLARTLVVLSSDHGALPLIERLRLTHPSAQRASPKLLQERVQAALKKRFSGKDGLVAQAMGADFWLDHQKIQEYGLSLEAVEKTIARALMSSGVIQKVYTRTDFLNDAPKNDPYFELHQNSFFASRSPDVFGRVKEFTYLDDRSGGTGHGTPYDYDRHVPIVFMGPHIAPGTFNEPCGPEDIAPTLARYFGVDFPKENDARLLAEMLR